MALVRKRLFASGRVQGVWFRASATREGEALGLAGWVRNLPDGRVEALVEGEEEQVAKFVAWFRRGPPLARVAEVREVVEEAKGDLEGFRTRY